MSMKVPEFDKHLKKAGGHIGWNIVEITIKMKTKTLNDKNHQALCQKFTQLNLFVFWWHSTMNKAHLSDFTNYLVFFFHLIQWLILNRLIIIQQIFQMKIERIPLCWDTVLLILSYFLYLSNIESSKTIFLKFVYIILCGINILFNPCLTIVVTFGVWNLNVQGAHNKFPAFFCMGTFIDSTRMKL